MFRNFVATALRNLVRNRLYAALNIGGLAVGFAAALLIALFVRDEYSYDRFFPDHERLYLMGFSSTTSPVIKADSTPVELAGRLRSDFPAVTTVATIAYLSAPLRHGSIEADENGVWADAAFLDMFKFPVVAGTRERALERPDSIVLTRSLARKYFGRDDPIGETIELTVKRRVPLTVTAVIEDLPSNTHLALRYLVAGGSPLSVQSQAAEKPPTDRDFMTSGYTYLKIENEAVADQVRAALPAFFRRYKDGVLNMGMSVSLNLRPIAALHLAAGERGMKPRGSATEAAAFSAIGVLIVLAAGINFVNLMTARAARRAMEVGVRKVTGAERKHLMAQFLGESLLYVAVGSILAALLTALLLPTLNTYLDRSITVDLLRDAAALGVALSVGLLIAFLAGFYPALMLSSFRPANVLKGRVLQRLPLTRVRESLVILQFGILIGLLIATGVNVRQNQYALAQAKRFNADQVVIVFSPCEGGFREGLRTLAGVRGVTCSSSLPFGIGNWIDPVEKADGTSVQIPQHGVGFGFFEFYGMKPVAGRFFEESRPGDVMNDDPDAVPMKASVVLNEAAVKALGFGTPAQAVGRTTRVTLTDNGPRGEPSEIIGVAPDFAADAVHSAVPPILYFVSPRPNFANVLSLRLDGARLPETLEAIDKLWMERGTSPDGDDAILRPIARRFLDQMIEGYYDTIKRQGQLFGVFAVISVFIAMLGLFGMSSALSENRTKEMGVRKAMGATSAEIVRLLLWQFCKPVLIANLIAWPVAATVMLQWLRQFANHVDLEPLLFLGASAAAVVIAMLTVLGHALQVVHAKPATALRHE